MKHVRHFRDEPMLKISSLLIVVAGLLVGIWGVHAAPVNKCIVGGTVTYQEDPCPFKQVRKLPTVQEMNAVEKKRREAAEAAATEKLTAAPEKAAIAPEKLAPTAPAQPRGFSCDGRQQCSQMKSCAEAKYFLANCPGVKMDGDKNGIPCEKQWCAR